MTSETPASHPEPTRPIQPDEDHINPNMSGRTTSEHVDELTTHASEYDRRVLEEDVGALQLPEAALDAILSRVNRFDTLSLDQFRGLIGLKWPDTDAKVIFRTLQDRGVIGTARDKNGSYAITHPPENNEDSARLGDSLRRGIGAAAVGKIHWSETVQNWKRMVGVRPEPRDTPPSYDDSTRPVIPGGAAVTKNPIDNPDYFGAGSKPKPDIVPIIRRPRV